VSVRGHASFIPVSFEYGLRIIKLRQIWINCLSVWLGSRWDKLDDSHVSGQVLIEVSLLLSAQWVVVRGLEEVEPILVSNIMGVDLDVIVAVSGPLHVSDIENSVDASSGCVNHIHLII